MNLKFPSLSAFWKSATQKSDQSNKVIGDNNIINQNTTIYTSEPQKLSHELPTEDVSVLDTSTVKPVLYGEIVEDDDSEDIKRIVSYRKIANNGDANTALKLLKDLKGESKFQHGYLAFRLNFNIGVILQNIGEYEEASSTLRIAHQFYPDHPKSKAGLAFAELLDGNYGNAFERACPLLIETGDHLDICAIIALHAATRLKREFRIEDYELCEVTHADVVLAHLEYIRVLQPDEFSNTLRNALQIDPKNKGLESLWAHTVLQDAKQNQAFLLGAEMSADFEENVQKNALIIRAEIENSLKERPPNKLLLPSQANNAAIALRLTGNISEAARLLDKTLLEHPELMSQLAQIRAVIYLQQDQDTDAFKIIDPLQEHADLQIMASEIEAKMGKSENALTRINSTLKLQMPDDLRCQALSVKARIAINSSNRDAADEAIEDLNADFAHTSDTILIKSAYTRAFELFCNESAIEELPTLVDENLPDNNQFIASFENIDKEDFFAIVQFSDELIARGLFRQCADILCDRVSFARESLALNTLCDACLRGGLSTMAKMIVSNLSSEVKESVFGWKFCANASYLTGEIAKAVPLTRKLHKENPKSLSALQWYIQSLLRMNDKRRIRKIVNELNDNNLTGTVAEKREYVNLLVFCNEIERARIYAYRLFCENQNDHRAWMALSASVLAFGKPLLRDKKLDLKKVSENAAVEIATSNGEKRKYIIETDDYLLSLRQDCIQMEHPIAHAMLGRAEGETFEWPIEGGNETATIISIKHKALDSFHFVMQRFEEKFPNANGFRSVKCDPSNENGLDEIKDMLRERAEYGQQKANEYFEGSYPLSILGIHLGLDPIDTYLGLHRDCGVSVKVSSCTAVSQEDAATLLHQYRHQGIIIDAVSLYMLRRMDLIEAIEAEFGKIGVTQNTIDILANRLQEAENAGSYSEDGERKSGHMSYHDGKIILIERSEEEIGSRINLLRSDLSWAQKSCELIPSVAKEDPVDEIIRFRNERGGHFFDDLFASDGSDRIFISNDFHLRQWGDYFFNIKSTWIQALLFYLESEKRIPTTKVVTATIQLLSNGEEALGINSHKIAVGATMLASGELSDEEFQMLCNIIGQPGADMQSHIKVVISAMDAFWSISSLNTVREKATSVVLRKLVRNQGSNSGIVIDTIQTLTVNYVLKQYISKWRVGHFI